MRQQPEGSNLGDINVNRIVVLNFILPYNYIACIDVCVTNLQYTSIFFVFASTQYSALICDVHAVILNLDLLN